MTWRVDARLRWAVGLLAGFASVAVFALIAKFVIESLTHVTYVIHWLETIPVLSLLAAYVIQRALRPEVIA